MKFHILNTPDHPLPPIDPPAWVLERKYAEQNYHEALEKFLSEREQSVKLLKSLKNPRWDNAYPHPKAGQVSAYLLLVKGWHMIICSSVR